MESWNHLGWKRPLRSSSPTVALTLPSPRGRVGGGCCRHNVLVFPNFCWSHLCHVWRSDCFLCQTGFHLLLKKWYC